MFYGWWIVVAGVGLSALIGGSAFYGLGAFFAPIQTEFHWTYSAVSWALAIQTLVFGVVAPTIGWLFDRWGPRIPALGGVVVSALSFWALSAVQTQMGLAVAFGLMGLGSSAATFVLLNSVVALWFRRKLGLAMAVSQTGYGIGGIMAPVFVLLIGAVGWRTAAQLIALWVLLLGVPLSLVLRHSPERYGLHPDGVKSGVASLGSLSSTGPSLRPQLVEGRMAQFTVRDALGTGTFWVILIVLSLSSAITVVVFTHQIRAMISYGLKPEVAGLVAGAAAIIGLAGRYGMGWLVAFVASRYLLACALGMQAAGVFVLSGLHPSSSAAITLFTILYGVGQGGIFVLAPLIQKEYFGTKAYGTIQGLLVGASMIVSTAAIVLAGFSVDSFGTYRPAFAVASIVGVVLVFSILLSRAPRAGKSKLDEQNSRVTELGEQNEAGGGTASRSEIAPRPGGESSSARRLRRNVEVEVTVVDIVVYSDYI